MVQVFICRDIPGYWGCPRCGTLWGMSPNCPGTAGAMLRGAICDFTSDELEEVAEELRNQAGRPDADHDEVVIMLDDPGIVEFVDPSILENTEFEPWHTTPF